MDTITVREIMETTGGRLLCGREEYGISGVKHDSRECATGDLFVAVIGENMDGHDYAAQAMDRGCQALLISHDGPWMKSAEEAGANVIMVDDTVYAMGELAKYYLACIDVKKIAVTGSVGKTSARDMIYYVLSEHYRCGRNMKNFNNEIGLPLSIFTFDSSMEAVVLEMGMSGLGEIDRLADIVKPDVGVITNIGVAHIESLGSREGIFRAKMEIAPHIGEASRDAGVLVFASDDEFLTKERTKGAYRQVSIGENGRSDYIISAVDDFGLDGIQFTLEHLEKTRRVSVPVPGVHSAVNSAIAVAVGDLLGVTQEEQQHGLNKVTLTGSRLRQVKNDRVTVIDDTYNASPDSMKSALKVLEQSRGYARKVAVLGDMYELGAESERQHYGVGVFARGLALDVVVAIGRDAKKICEGASGGMAVTAYYEGKEDFCQEMDRWIGKGDIVLVKGSRGMEMEQIVENILEQ